MQAHDAPWRVQRQMEGRGQRKAESAESATGIISARLTFGAARHTFVCLAENEPAAEAVDGVAAGVAQAGSFFFFAYSNSP